MNEILRSEILTSRDDLATKIINLLLVSLEKVLLYVLFEVTFAIFKKEIEIVGCFFDI